MYRALPLKLRFTTVELVVLHTLTSHNLEVQRRDNKCVLIIFQAFRNYTGDRNYIYDPVGIVTDEHGGNRTSIQRMLKDDMVSRAKSCETHFYDVCISLSAITRIITKFQHTGSVKNTLVFS